MASDGLFDNVPDQDLIKVFEDANSENLQEKTLQLAMLCTKLANNPDYLSPFALSARKEGYTTEGRGSTNFKFSRKW